MSRPPRCNRRTAHARERMRHLYTSRIMQHGVWTTVCSWCMKPKPEPDADAAE